MSDAASSVGDAGRSVGHVFCGTSEFAATVLAALAASPHRPLLVVTPPDRRSGRGRRMTAPPVAEAARGLGLELHQSADVNAPDSRRAVLERQPELATVCAFGQLIKQPLIGELPMLNVHPSLLPRWRGAAPIERAIMAGDEASGVCVMRLTEGLDSGPVALREEVPIAPVDTYGTLAPRLAQLGSRLLVEALDLHAAGALDERFAEQAAGGVTYAEKIAAAERRIDPARPARQEALRSRGLSPHVGTLVATRGGERLGLRALRSVEAGPPAGEFEWRDASLLLGCTPGALEVAELQPAGGRWMAAADYIRGRGLPAPVDASSAP